MAWPPFNVAKWWFSSSSCSGLVKGGQCDIDFVHQVLRVLQTNAESDEILLGAVLGSPI